MNDVVVVLGLAREEREDEHVRDENGRRKVLEGVDEGLGRYSYP